MSAIRVITICVLILLTKFIKASQKNSGIHNLETRGTVGQQVTSAKVNENGTDFLNVYWLNDKGDFAEIDAQNEDMISYFCHRGIEASLPRFWSSASLNLGIESSDYLVSMGPNLTMVDLAHNYAWLYTQLPWKSREFRISPFENTCVGLQTSKAYTVQLQIKNVNYFFLLATACGIAVYLMAPRLCRNQFFHFTTGIGAGIVLSVLILTFLLQRKLKVSLFSWIGLFYSLSVYFITSTWYNIKDYFVAEYYPWLAGYILTAGLVSFAVVYRMGPPSNPKTLNLIQWTMQAMSLLVVVLSSYHQTASMGLAILLLTWSAIPEYVKSAAQTQFRKRICRPKMKLLSEEEYAAQGYKETAKALEELRKFCQSPESKPWQMVRKLNTPSRFAEFIEGAPHITETEILDYSHWDLPETDDEDDRMSLTDEEESRSGDRSFDAQM